MNLIRGALTATPAVLMLAAGCASVPAGSQARGTATSSSVSSASVSSASGAGGTASAVGTAARTQASPSSGGPAGRGPAGRDGGMRMVMPRFYVTVVLGAVNTAKGEYSLLVTVRRSSDGKETGSVTVPGPRVELKSARATHVLTTPAWSVAAAADDRHFAVQVGSAGGLPGSETGIALYSVTVSQAGLPGTPHRIAYQGTGDPVTGMGLSPDGTKLAVTTVHEFPRGQGWYGGVQLIDLASGAARTYSGSGSPGYWPGTPAWSGDGHTVFLPWWHATQSGGGYPASVEGVRALPAVPEPGAGSLLTVSRLTRFPAPVPGISSALVTAGGHQLAVSSCQASGGRATVRIEDLSGTDGHRLATVYTASKRFADHTAAQNAIGGGCRVLGADPAGRFLLIRSFTFGRVAGHAFTGLPGAPPGPGAVAAAW